MRRVEVFALLVGFEHPLVARDLGGDPELDLRVVGLDEHPAFRGADVPLDLGREMLEGGLGAGHAAGPGADLVPVGVDPVSLADELKKLRPVVTQHRRDLLVLEEGLGKGLVDPG